MKLMGEEALVQHCKRGENAARRELYDTYAGQMLAICYRYAGGMDVSRDLLHDGFLKVFSSISSFLYRGAGSLRAWMSRIFVNTALEYLKRKEMMREVVPLDQIAEPEDVEEELSEIPTQVLMQFVRELPVGYRTVFNLYTFEEMSHKEIAALLHINERSSSSQLARAKALLVRKINEYIRRQSEYGRKG